MQMSSIRMEEGAQWPNKYNIWETLLTTFNTNPDYRSITKFKKSNELKSTIYLFSFLETKTKKKKKPRKATETGYCNLKIVAIFSHQRESSESEMLKILDCRYCGKGMGGRSPDLGLFFTVIEWHTFVCLL